ncbi:MAG: hypothetical protein GXP56_10550 [Deltaproteobacteria bacterium]|nr:hypothetical protein [Deltaproteobacteria bacterium]
MPFKISLVTGAILWQFYAELNLQNEKHLSLPAIALPESWCLVFLSYAKL